jgi:hypothetical protein
LQRRDFSDDSGACDLFSENNCWSALSDEPEPDGPQMPLVGHAGLLAGRTKGLAGTGTSPNRSIIGPAGEPESVGPDADSCKEMALGVSHKVICFDIHDASFIHVPRGDVPR